MNLQEEIAELRKELDALRESFQEHYEWHKHNENVIQKAASNFFKTYGILYAVARSREDAKYAERFEFGPTPDLVAARNSPDSDDNRVLVEFQDSAVNDLGHGRIVAEYLHGCWHNLEEPEEL